MLADNVNAREEDNKGRYHRLFHEKNEKIIDSQSEFFHLL